MTIAPIVEQLWSSDYNTITPGVSTFGPLGVYRNEEG